MELREKITAAYTLIAAATAITTAIITSATTAAGIVINIGIFANTAFAANILYFYHLATGVSIYATTTATINNSAANEGRTELESAKCSIFLFL